MTVSQKLKQNSENLFTVLQSKSPVTPCGTCSRATHLRPAHIALFASPLQSSSSTRDVYLSDVRWQPCESPTEGVRKHSENRLLSVKGLSSDCPCVGIHDAGW